MVDDLESSVAAVNHIPVVPMILDIVCHATGMGFAAVALVTEKRWIACSVKDDIALGLQSGSELDIQTTICNEIRQRQEPVVINNVAEDPRYCNHPTPLLYGFQSYISMPIFLHDGRFFGTLCAVDPRPARVQTPEVIGMFKLFAELIAFHLDASEQVATSKARLLVEQKTSEMREQFIAVLGHDLRNPLAGIRSASDVLLKTPLSAKASRMVGIIRTSATRMSGLIDNVLDFARGRLGDGLALRYDTNALLQPVLMDVIAELQASCPERKIDTVIAVESPVNCDPERIAQLLSNLLGNALTYGAAATPVLVRAATEGDIFELSVANAGDPIPPAMQERIFQPFQRGNGAPSQQGLGLGLFIASEIARAHCGTLDVHSSTEETRFRFRMPIARSNEQGKPVGGPAD